MERSLLTKNTPSLFKRRRIDWETLCETQNLVTQAQGIITSASREIKLWPGLLAIVCQQLKGKGQKRICQELGHLKTILDAHLKLTKPSQDYWDAEYMLFRHFILHWGGYFVGQPSLNDPPWSFLDKNDAAQRYDELLAKLLRERGNLLMAECLADTKLATLPPSIRQYNLIEVQLGVWEKEFTSLTQLTRGEDPQENKPGEGYLVSFFNATLRWLGQLLQLFFSSKDEPIDALNLLKMFNRIATLVLRYHLIPLPQEEEKKITLSAFKDIHQFYLQVPDQFNVANFKPTLLPSRSIQVLQKQIKADLNTLRIWSYALLNDILLRFSQETFQQSLDALLQGFILLQKKANHLGSELYAWRMQAEEAWQQNQDYLSELSKLDNQLATTEDDLLKLQKNWLSYAKNNSISEWVIKACECLEILLRNEMVKLAGVRWAEYTCYYFGLSEGRLAYEMKARNQQRSQPWFIDKGYHSYHPRYVFTQTDFLMTIYTEGQAASLRQFLKFIYPDKFFASNPQLMPVAKYCFNEVVSLLKLYTQVNRAWYAGQWYASAPLVKQAGSFVYLPEQGTFRQQEPSIIKKPQMPLGFAIAKLHQAYINWANNQPSLIKYIRRSLAVQHCLYEGSGDELSIESDLQWRETYFKRNPSSSEEITMASSQWSPKKAEEVNKFEVIGELETTMEKGAEREENPAEQELMRKFLLKKLNQNLGFLVSLSSEKIKKQLNAISIEIAAQMDKPPEHIQELLAGLLREKPQLVTLKQKLDSPMKNIGFFNKLTEIKEKPDTEENPLPIAIQL